MYPRFEPDYSPDSETVNSLQREQAEGAFFSGLDHDLSVFILRHGQSEGNASNKYQGRLDFPLSARGEAQARAAGEWLKEIKPDRIISSPMLRARRSAEIIAETAGISRVELSDILIEVDVGLFSGIDPDTAAQRHPELWSKFYTRSWDAVPDAETSRQMYARAILAWREIREMGMRGASRVVCMTHGGLVQWLMKSTFGAHAWLPLFPMSNCGISRYDIECVAKGSPAFVAWSLIDFHPPVAPNDVKPAI